MAKMQASGGAKGARVYKHPEEESLLRPEIGVQANFKQTRDPVDYRYDSSLSPEMQWDEQPARAEAEAQICLTRQGYETLFARTRRSVRAASGMVVRTESLFPRYVFIHSDPSLQSLEPVRSTRGVTTIVRFGGEPARVPDAVIEQIRARIDVDDGFVKLAPPEMLVGTKVRINEGPFSGLDAIFAARHGEDRVRLLLTMLGSEREIVVPRSVLGARI